MNVWKFILQKHEAGSRVILLYVLESIGSSPGRQGFSMAVSADGQFYGTIGGGIMEHKLVELAKSRLQKTTQENEVIQQIHNKDAAVNQSGMICSGEQTIFLYEVQAQDLSAIKNIIHSVEDHKNGTLTLTGKGIQFSDQVPKQDFYFQPSGDEFLLLEKTGYKNALYVIGGGHCALALSKIASDLGFFITVFDEREGLNTMDQNTYAHKKIIVKSYLELSERIPGGNNVYVVIMTFGYRTDDIAVRALINKDFKYLGLLGSKKKLEKMIAEYTEQGIGTQNLEKMHAPVGIQIKSQTTFEIAVSIAAEIIRVKNEFL